MLMAAMVPIALGQGPGASARASMAKVIIGGQALSLLISLLATPIVYSLLDDLKQFLSKRTLGEPAVSNLNMFSNKKPDFDVSG